MNKNKNRLLALGTLATFFLVLTLRTNVAGSFNKLFSKYSPLLNLQNDTDNTASKTAATEYDEVIAKTPDLTLVKKGIVVGFLDRHNNFAPLATSDNGNFLATGMAIIFDPETNFDGYTDSGNFCVVDRRGEILISAKTYDTVDDSRIDRLCQKLSQAEKFPFLTKNSQAKQKLSGLRPILINDKYGYINARSELVIAPQFRRVEAIEGGYHIVTQESLTGIITPAGKYIPLPTKNNGEYQANEVTLVGYADHYGDRYCIIARGGNFLLSAAASNSSRPDKIAKIDNVCRNLVGIEANNELVKEPEDTSSSTQESPYGGYSNNAEILFSINGKSAYINTKGELAFPQLFDGIGSFSEGLAAVRNGDRFGFINRAGKMVLNVENYLPYSKITSQKNCEKYNYFGTLSSFENDLAIVSKIDNVPSQIPACSELDKAKKYYLNKNNQIVAGDLIETSFDSATKIAPNLIKTKIKFKDSNGKISDLYGLIRLDGEIVTQHVFKYVGSLRGKYIKVQYDSEDSFDWINSQGTRVSQPH